MEDGLDGRVVRKHGIFQPIFGAQQMARDGNHQPWEDPRMVRANRNRPQLGRSPPRVLQRAEGRVQVVRGLEKICSSNESKRCGAEAEAAVASHLFHHGRDQAQDWTKQKRA